MSAASLMAAVGIQPPAAFAAKVGDNASVYTRVGAQPFINLTATYTINGGALTRPEVKRVMEEASYWPVNLDELMEKVGAHLAKLLGAESAIVTSGAAAALTHATSGAVAGTDPEKMQQLPDLTGLKNEVVIPKQSRNPYDHAIRTVGVKMVEVSAPEQIEAAITERTALVAMLGTGEPNGPVKLEHLAAAAHKRGIPVLVDGAAELPKVPNPFLSRGADMVAYSGGKFLRGPQCAGLLIGRKDCIAAAWANSSPHHTFGRAMKVGKEEIMGMVAAIEVWRNNYDLEGEYRTWNGWLKEIGDRVARIDGVKYQLKPPAGASPFPVMDVSWDSAKIGFNAGEVGQLLLNGNPRIMSHAEGEGYGFRIRPVAMKAGEAKLVAQRLEEILKSAPKGVGEKPAKAPVADISGEWSVELTFKVGTAKHKLELQASGNQVTGTHRGRVANGKSAGTINGDEVTLSSSLRYEGQTLQYRFRGKVQGNRMNGDVDLGEYGSATFTAVRG
ncbi:MAG: aminotransferase class V-fold PLP-dependent enzyme [Bryobacteraceae bacterium]